MAYIRKEEIGEIRQNLKKEFGNRFKFSVTCDNHSGVRVLIMEMDEGDLDFQNDRVFNGYDDEQRENAISRLDKGQFEVNVYWIEDHWTGECLNVFKRINEICQVGEKGSYDRNAGDMGADYSNMTYYVYIGVGKYNKPLKIRELA